MADRIVVLEKGKIAEQAATDSLLLLEVSIRECLSYKLPATDSIP